MQTHNQRLGIAGEVAAGAYLSGLGHEILERNWRCRSGEIDLITQLSGQIIAVEVKTRSSDKFGTPFDAISEQKLHRIQRLILLWAQTRGRYVAQVRVDILCLYPQSGGWRIEHHQAVES